MYKPVKVYSFTGKQRLQLTYSATKLEADGYLEEIIEAMNIYSEDDDVNTHRYELSLNYSST